MQPFRFIHAADLHLDSPFKGMSALPEAIRERLRRSTFDALDGLVRLAVQERADFVLVAGDVYDAADRSLKAQIRFQKAMRRLSDSGIPAYIIHGNHDPDDGRAARLDWPASVRFFSSAEPETVTVIGRSGEPLAAICGMSYASAAVADNLAARYAHDGAASYRIGLLHTNVDGDDGHDNYAPSSLRELVASGFDYWALGHIHARRILHEAPYVVYPGNTQGRSVRELGARGCYVVDVSQHGETRLAFHALDAVRWFERQVSIEGAATDQELKDRVEALLEQTRADADGRPAVMRLIVDGRGPLHAKLNAGSYLDELLTEFRESEAGRADGGDFVWLESAKLRTGAEADVDSIKSQEGFLGDLLRMGDGLLADERLLAAFCGEAAAALYDNPKTAKLAASAFGDAEQREWIRAAQQLAIDLLYEPEDGV